MAFASNTRSLVHGDTLSVADIFVPGPSLALEADPEIQKRRAPVRP